MGKSLNKCSFIGNCGKDPDIVNSNSGVKIAKVSLAVNDSYKDKGGEWQEKTEWINLVAFSKLADVIESYVKKGSQIYVEGKLQTRSYEKDGTTKYFTEVVVNELILLGSKVSSSNNSEPRVAAGVSASRPVTNTDPINSEDIPF